MAGRAMVVINPSKFDDVEAAKGKIVTAFTARGWEEPTFFETTVEDPGVGQARQALVFSPDVVCAMGGDGTVRMVASALAGTDIPLGLLPSGTGNLLARNLEIPVDDDEAAVEIITGGQNLRMDIGRMEIHRTGRGYDNEVFLIMAGIGFDAEVMGAVPAQLKARVGWFAYLIAATQKIIGRRFRVRLSVDGSPAELVSVRSVVIGNVGKLTMGVSLIPDADVTNGKVNVVLVTPRSLWGWTTFMVKVARQTRARKALIEAAACVHMQATPVRPVEVELDGDHMGFTTGIRVDVDPACLLVRVAPDSAYLSRRTSPPPAPAVPRA